MHKHVSWSEVSTLGLPGSHPGLLFAETDSIWSYNVAKLVNTWGFSSAFQTHVRQTGSLRSSDLFWGEEMSHARQKEKHIWNQEE